ncbi:M23 family metallopeptidase [Marinobacter fonticola]|uniref:M23 family metallopeptidase n=1 Tax=Marinobacter fonticola TaxID=2603215 RepID=UPI001D0DBF2C|nr:M23 family metallopeptidase [Marinobacter fonticola]
MLLTGLGGLIGVPVHAEPATLSGSLAQGSLVSGTVAPGSLVWLDDTPVRVSHDGRFALGFGRDAELEYALRVQSPDGTETLQILELEERTYAIQRIEGVPSRTVTPSDKHLARIRAEAEKVKQARTVVSDRLAFLGPYIWPARGRISGVYGSQRVYNGEPRRPHYGVDVAAPRGAPVVAPAAGTVTLAEPDLFFSGGTVILDHGFGVSSTFLHMDAVEVAVGQGVDQGEQIGKVGSTGRSTGPHLDWRMNWYDERVDPVSIAPPLVNGRTPERAQTATVGK